MSRPIRVGLIGLGHKAGGMAAGVWATNAHLPYLLSSPKYEIVALANSTIASAQAAINFHNLGPNTKAYGTPEDLANDPDVDLVVVCVKITQHYNLTKPAILAGKDVFVEWPLAANIAEAEELTALAAAKGVKTMIGLQARLSPLLAKLKNVISDGHIGTVISSTVTAIFAGLPSRTDGWPAGAEYYLDENSGGDSFSINFGHCKQPTFPMCS
jgi:predicted dehydrogenase